MARILTTKFSTGLLPVSRQVWFIALFLSVTVYSNRINAQCDLTVDAGPDQTICSIPATFQLQGTATSSDPIRSIIWSPSTGLSDPNSLTPTVTLSSPMTYVLTVSSIDYDNDLVINGDFEQGNTGFTTDYTYNPDPNLTTNELDEGQYSIGTNPAPMHRNWVDCGDHTTGNGNMMLVNGHETAGQNVWCQTITVTPDTDYAFSVWVTSVDPNGPCLIQFKINGDAIGDGNLALSETCSWQEFAEFWNSGTNTTATICIEDLNTDEAGNDFAIDDILFAPVCEESDEVTLTPSFIDVSIISNGSIFCEGETLDLEAIGADTYEWSGPDNFTSSSSIISIPDLTLDNEGLYTVIGTNPDGCMDTTSLYISIISPTEENIYKTSCDPAQVGVFRDKFSNLYGCDSIIITTITYVDSDTTTSFRNTCNFSETGIFTDRLTNQAGCDSTVITTITYREPDTTYVDRTTCDSMLAGILIDTLKNVWNCDSLVITSIEYVLSDTTYISNNTCDSSLVGVSTQMLTGQSGCDSTIITIITLSPKDTSYLERSTCNPDEKGVFSETHLNQMGCDSTIVTTITLIPSDTSYLNLTTCDSTKTGRFIKVLSNQQGCDSIIYTDVLLMPLDTNYIYNTTCDPAQAGTYSQNISTQSGCDSIVVTTLTLLPRDSTFTIVNSCDPTEVGIFSTDLINQYGCDSTIITTVELIEGDTSYVINFTCDSSQAGVFLEEFTNQYGCDSTVITSVELTTIDSEISITSNYNEWDISCSGQNDGSAIVTVSGGEGPYNYQWSSGSRTMETLNLTAGTYTVLVTDVNGCTDLSEITLVEPTPILIDLTISAPNCFSDNNGQIIVGTQGGTEPFTYSLNEESFQNLNIFSGLSDGVYELQAMDINGCTSSEIISLNTPLPLSVYLGDDISIEYGENAYLQAFVNAPYDSLATILWQSFEELECESCLNQNVSPIVTSSYSIQITDVNGCAGEDELTVFVSFDRDIYAPDVFTPNGDGFNDTFTLFAKQGNVLSIESLKVFDRWGNMLFNQSDFLPNTPSAGWDGTYRGRTLDPAVFVWLAEVEFINGTRETLAGDVTILK